MRTSLPLLALLIAASALSTGVTAQRQTRPAAAAASRDPFVGVWKLSAEKSNYESGGAPKSFVRTYEDRGGGTIFMTTDVTIPQGSARAYLVYRRDGKPYPEAAAGADSIRMVSVTSVNPRTEDVYFIVDGKTPEKPSTITISPDGMTMTQVVNGTTSKGKPFTNTVVYDKQS
jgi:hypothetical protein